MNNDVAVITMSEAVTWSKHISAACLPPGPQPDGTASSGRPHWTGCRVSGWGTESFDRPRYPGVLKKVGVPLWDRDGCVRSLRTTRLGGKFKLHEGFLCAGGEEHEDACKASTMLTSVMLYPCRVQVFGRPDCAYQLEAIRKD
jgi:hypothetical protein